MKHSKLILTTLLTLAFCIPTWAQKTVEYPDELPVGMVYLFGCQRLDAEGDYQETLATTGGDSIVYLHLKRPVPPPAITTAYLDSIENGQVYLFGCQRLNAEGTYTETLTRANGADSIVKVTLKFIKHEPITVAYTDSIEEGQVYLFGCQRLNAEGAYTETLKRANGADSIVKLTLKFIQKEPITVAYTDSIEEGQVYLFGCQRLNAEGTYTETLTRANGADSIVKLTLKFIQKESITVAYTDSIDEGQVYLFGCQRLNAEGTYTEVLKRANGADSIVQLTLKVNTCAYDSVADAPIYLCQDSSLVWNNYTFNIVNDTILRLDTINRFGCDSIATVEVYVMKMVLDSTLTLSVFADSSILPITWINGVNYSTTTLRHDTVRYVQTGCDSAHYTLDLTVTPIEYRPVVAFDTLCPGTDTYSGPRQVFNINTTDTVLRDSVRLNIVEAAVVKRVDSVYIFNIHRLPAIDSIPEAPINICQDSTVSWKGTVYTVINDTVLVKKYTSRFGCDSIRSVEVHVQHVIDMPQEADTFLCGSPTYIEWRNKTFTLTQDTTLLRDTARYAFTGCDSLRFSRRVIRYPHNPADDSTLTLTVYAGDAVLPILWIDGNSYSTTTNRIDTLRYVQTGCDSAYYKLDLTVLIPERREVTTIDTICRTSPSYETRTGTVILTNDSVWYDSLRVSIVESGITIQVDSIYNYKVSFYSDIKTLPRTILDNLKAVCGLPLDTAAAQADVRLYLQTPQPGTYLDPNATITWYVKHNGIYVPKASDTIVGSQSKVDVRCQIYNQTCNIRINIDTTLTVAAPAPVKTWLHGKFGHWLMMIHLDSLQHQGYTINPEDVEWYQVTGPATADLKATGYYYTTEDELQGEFYAVIHAENSHGCAAAIVSDTIDWSQPYHQMPIRLVPNAVASGNTMRLENLDDEHESEISIYDPAGKLTMQFISEGKQAVEFSPHGQPGVYLVRVQCGDNKQTLRYLIK